MPQSAAGSRTEHAEPVPSAKSTSRPATAHAEPLEEPPEFYPASLDSSVCHSVHLRRGCHTRVGPFASFQQAMRRLQAIERIDWAVNRAGACVSFQSGLPWTNPSTSTLSLAAN